MAAAGWFTEYAVWEYAAREYAGMTSMMMQNTEYASVRGCGECNCAVRGYASVQFASMHDIQSKRVCKNAACEYAGLQYVKMQNMQSCEHAEYAVYAYSEYARMQKTQTVYAVRVMKCKCASMQSAWMQSMGVTMRVYRLREYTEYAACEYA